MSRAPALALLPLLFACKGEETADGPTYHADAKAIVDAKCATCHRPGDIGPFPLTSYGEVKDFEEAVRASIVNDTMPPWQPSDDCTDYVGNFDLTEAERETMLSWLDAGAPEGDPTDAPAGGGGESGQSWVADLTLQLPEPYTPEREPDDYRCQLIPWPEDEVTYVTGFRVIPDQRAIVHHAIGFLIGPDQVAQYQAWDDAEEGPGYTCYGGPSASSSGGLLESLDREALLAALDTLGITLVDLQSGAVTTEELAALFEELGISGQSGLGGSLGSWVPGAADLPLPAGTGIRVEPGSMIVAQMHYNTQSAEPVADQSTLEIAVTDTVERPATTLVGIDLGWVSSGLFGEAMDIPAGESEVTHSTTLEYDGLMVQMTLNSLGLAPGDPIVLHSANHHMHSLGETMSSTISHVDGTESCLLENPDWDFNWQGSYQFVQPVVLGPGDRLEVTCTWDNSAANQPVVDGEVRDPVDVAWGEGTSDEMCLGAFYATSL
jgi:mono/diheme cytochrome c family protein